MTETYLSRDQILAWKPKTKTVAVEQWGGEIKVREPNAEERLDYFNAFQTEANGRIDRKAQGMAAAKLVVRCVLDQNDDRLFTDEDAKSLMKNDWLAIQSVVNDIAELGGIYKSADEKEESIADLPDSQAGDSACSSR